MAKTAKRKAAPARKARKGYPPFITAVDLLPQQPERFTILPSISLYQREDRSTSLFLQIQRKNGEQFTLGVNANSPDRISLQQQIGRNLIEWPGKIITLHRQRGSQGGQFVNVYDPSYTDNRLSPVPDDDIPF